MDKFCVPSINLALRNLAHMYSKTKRVVSMYSYMIKYQYVSIFRYVIYIYMYRCVSKHIDISIGIYMFQYHISYGKSCIAQSIALYSIHPFCTCAISLVMMTACDTTLIPIYCSLYRNERVTCTAAFAFALHINQHRSVKIYHC